MKVERLNEGDHEAFLAFSESLYDPVFRTENKRELRELLEGKHPLSHYFKVIPLVVKDAGRIVCRAVVTCYPDDPAAYLGYFESENNPEAAALLMNDATHIAHMHGKKTIEGPMNASFWLGYRLKVNHFDKEPYFSELYNRDYYQALWEANGFERRETYYSNFYAPVDEKIKQEKYQKRYQQFTDKGYRIVSPTKQSLDNDFQAVSGMLQDRFRTFPVFKGISEEEFMVLFENLKLLLNLRYVKLAYDSLGKFVGFVIAVPDYGTQLSKETLSKKEVLKALLTKQMTRNYVIMYMAVKEQHEGLGSALVYAVIQEFKRYRVQSISSYIHEGKVSGSYVISSITDQNEYVYYEKKIGSGTKGA